MQVWSPALAWSSRIGRSLGVDFEVVFSRVAVEFIKLDRSLDLTDFSHFEFARVVSSTILPVCWILHSCILSRIWNLGIRVRLA